MIQFQKLRHPVYPYLFVLFTVISYLNQSPLSASLLGFLSTVGIVVLFTFIILICLQLIIRDWEKSAFLGLLMLILVFTYERLEDLLEPTRYYGRLYQYHLPLIGYLLLIASGIFLIWKWKVFPKTLTKLTSFFTLLLLVMALIGTVQAFSTIHKTKQVLTPPQLSTSGTKPDIYYLVFDEYTGPHALQDLYSFDDSGVLNELGKRGFYVANNSSANYFGSLHALASTMNFQFLDGITQQLTKKTTDQGVMEDIQQENRTVTALKNVGYTYYQIGSWWEPTSISQQARNFDSSSSFFGLHPFTFHFLSETTVVRYLFQLYFPAKSRDDVAYQQQQTTALAKTASGPKFVFTHVLLPHLPDIYDANCQPLSFDQSNNSAGNTIQYLNQVQCTNQIILSMVNNILASSKTPPVIIVQSDEGQEIKYSDPQSTADPVGAFEEKYSIMNAMYFPDHNYSTLYPTMTAINTFPILFNHYFGTNLPLLPDRNLMLDDYWGVNNSQDVTDIVRKGLGILSVPQLK